MGGFFVIIDLQMLWKGFVHMSAYTYEIVRESSQLPALFKHVCIPSKTITAHWHEYLEIIFVISGKMSAIIQAEAYEILDGDILIINSGDIHMTQTYGEKTDYLLLQISIRQLLQFVPDFKSLRFFTKIPAAGQNPSGAGEPGSCLLELLRLYEQQPDGYPLLFSARLYELLYCLYIHYSCRTSPDDGKNGHLAMERIIRIMDWVGDAYCHSICLDDAAGLLGLSREYFCRIFKKYTGQTFLEYVNDIRVMKLYEELICSDETITNLMERHGITNYKVFLRTFKKLYGTTPQRCRRKKSSLLTEL